MDSAILLDLLALELLILFYAAWYSTIYRQRRRRAIESTDKTFKESRIYNAADLSFGLWLLVTLQCFIWVTIHRHGYASLPTYVLAQTGVLGAGVVLQRALKSSVVNKRATATPAHLTVYTDPRMFARLLSSYTEVLSPIVNGGYFSLILLLTLIAVIELLDGISKLSDFAPQSPISSLTDLSTLLLLLKVGEHFAQKYAGHKRRTVRAENLKSELGQSKAALASEFAAFRDKAALKTDLDVIRNQLRSLIQKNIEIGEIEVLRAQVESIGRLAESPTEWVKRLAATYRNELSAVESGLRLDLQEVRESASRFSSSYASKVLELEHSVRRQESIVVEYLTPLSLGINLNDVPLHRMVPLGIYLPQGDGHALFANIVGALKGIGFQLIQRGPVYDGSWIGFGVVGTVLTAVGGGIGKILQGADSRSSKLIPCLLNAKEPFITVVLLPLVFAKLTDDEGRAHIYMRDLGAKEVLQYLENPPAVMLALQREITQHLTSLRGPLSEHTGQSAPKPKKLQKGISSPGATAKDHKNPNTAARPVGKGKASLSSEIATKHVETEAVVSTTESASEEIFPGASASLATDGSRGELGIDGAPMGAKWQELSVTDSFDSDHIQDATVPEDIGDGAADSLDRNPNRDEQNADRGDTADFEG